MLAESIRNNFVVLFTDENSGIIVKNGKCNSIGECSNNYLFIYDTTILRILSPEESIVLSND